MTDRCADVFEHHRGYLFFVAYRLLGSVSDAEDVVQDAFIRWRQRAPEDVRSPRAFLATVVVRLAMDELRSARAKREVYVGPWLPEPLLTSGREDLTDSIVLRESISFAFLLMLEKLGPLERAVFVLREVFDYDYAEIAAMVDKSEANCRQVFHRARQRLGEEHGRFHPTREQHEQVTRQFLQASASGDVQALLELLTEDAISISDGGGKAVGAGLRPVHSRERISRGLVGNLLKRPPDRAWIEEINGQPAIVATLRGEPYAALLLELDAGGQAQVVYTVANPDKLHHLFSGRSTPNR